MAGATLIEKHICLKSVKALDTEFSVSESDLTRYKAALKNLKNIKKNEVLIKKLFGKKFFFLEINLRQEVRNLEGQFSRRKHKKG